MLKLILTTIFATFAIVSQAQTTSDRIVALNDELKLSVAEAGKLDGQLSGFTLANETLMKENKVLSDNRTQQYNQGKAIKEAGEKYLESERRRLQADIDAIVAQYNALGCVGTLPQARYDYCQNMFSHYSREIETKKRNGQIHLDRIAADTNQKVAPIIDIINRQTARIDQIAGQMKANFDGFNKTKDRQAYLKKRIGAIKVELADLCSNAKPGSAVYQLCNQINWDGARTDLPGQSGPGRGTVVTPNR